MYRAPSPPLPFQNVLRLQISTLPGVEEFLKFDVVIFEGRTLEKFVKGLREVLICLV